MGRNQEKYAKILYRSVERAFYANDADMQRTFFDIIKEEVKLNTQVTSSKSLREKAIKRIERLLSTREIQ
jgi:hypothetical protein